MIRAIAAIGLLAGLSACSSEAPTPAPEQPVTTASNVATPPAATPTATAAARLPRDVIGTWTADKDDRCTPGTPLRIVVAAGTITFYESVARVTGVTQVDPHSWGIDATVIGEGATREQSFDLNLNENGTMTRVEAPIPDITYTRCESET